METPAANATLKAGFGQSLRALWQLGSANECPQSAVEGICSRAKGYLNADEASKANASQITSPGTSTYRPPNYTGIDTAANSGR